MSVAAVELPLDSNGGNVAVNLEGGGGDGRSDGSHRVELQVMATLRTRDKGQCSEGGREGALIGLCTREGKRRKGIGVGW
ncbi:hypothetical protein ACP70R_014375 [Stipagrostis hirtigluma subsp. patula]